MPLQGAEGIGAETHLSRAQLKVSFTVQEARHGEDRGIILAPEFFTSFHKGYVPQNSVLQLHESACRL